MQNINLPETGTLTGLGLVQGVNTGFDSIQQNLAGILTKSVAGAADVTLSAAESYNGIIILTGTLTGNINVIMPASAMKWVVRNQTSGSFSLTVKTATGSGVAVLQGDATILYCDGTDVVEAVEKQLDPTLSALAALNSTVGAVYQTGASAFNKAPLSGKNRIINGRMLVDQRYAGAAHTITAGADLAYTVDRWWAACTGANVTGQQVSTGYQFTGAASVTGIQFGQRIERLNSFDLAGSNATFQVQLANSLLTSVTWTAYYANTNDTFGTLAAPAKTQIATGTFTVTSTLTQYSATFAVPSAATTGIEIVFSVGAQTSGTWVIGKVQFEKGSVATGYEIEDIELSNVRCMRYYETASAKIGGYNIAGEHLRSTVYYAIKRAAPTVTIITTEAGNAGTITVDLATSNSLRYLQAVTATGSSYSSSLLYIDSEMKS